MYHRFWRYRRRSESESIKFLLKQDLSGTTLLDIGANKGIYTYWMSKKAGRQGQVFSFEPQPELGDFLAGVKESFKLQNVRIQNKGLSDKEGTFDMFRSHVGSGGAHLVEEGQPLPEDNSLHRVEVEVSTLDNFFRDKDPGKISFIKCDVEGNELAVFKGGEKLLGKHMPTLLFECGHEEAEKGALFSYLTGLGYRGFFIHENRKIDYREFNKYPYRKPSMRHRNYMFVKK